MFVGMKIPTNTANYSQTIIILFAYLQVDVNLGPLSKKIVANSK